MSAALLVTTYATMLLAFLSSVSMARAAAHWSGRVRWAFRAASVVAFVYACSYVWLLHDVDRVAEWSRALRPLGIAAWGLVWIILPWMLTNDLRRKARRLDRAAGRIEQRK